MSQFDAAARPMLPSSLCAGSTNEHVSALMLSALAPSAIEVSLQVAEDLELDVGELHRPARDLHVTPAHVPQLWS